MTFSLVQSFGNTAADCVGGLTPGSSLTAGNLLTLFVATDYSVSGAAPVITPVATGLTFVAATGVLPQFTNNDFCQLFIVKNLTGGTAPLITVTVTGTSGGGYGIQATGAEWSGVSTTAPIAGGGSQYAYAASTNYFGPTTTTLSGITVGNLIVISQLNLDGNLTAATVTSGTTTAGFTTPYASGRTLDGQYQTAVSTSQSATNVATGAVYAAPGVLIVEYAAAGGGGGLNLDEGGPACAYSFLPDLPWIARPVADELPAMGPIVAPDEGTILWVPAATPVWMPPSAADEITVAALADDASSMPLASTDSIPLPTSSGDEAPALGPIVAPEDPALVLVPPDPPLQVVASIEEAPALGPMIVDDVPVPAAPAWSPVIQVAASVADDLIVVSLEEQSLASTPIVDVQTPIAAMRDDEITPSVNIVADDIPAVPILPASPLAQVAPSIEELSVATATIVDESLGASPTGPVDGPMLVAADAGNDLPAMGPIAATDDAAVALRPPDPPPVMPTPASEELAAQPTLDDAASAMPGALTDVVAATTLSTDDVMVPAALDDASYRPTPALEALIYIQLPAQEDVALARVTDDVSAPSWPALDQPMVFPLSVEDALALVAPFVPDDSAPPAQLRTLDDARSWLTIVQSDDGFAIIVILGPMRIYGASDTAIVQWSPTDSATLQMTPGDGPIT